MTVFEVLNKVGTAALLRFAGAVVLFLVLHLVRLPLVLIVRVLEGVMRRVDGFATRQASTRPTGPINQFFAPENGKETAGAYA
jgi:hypothetical protein